MAGVKTLIQMKDAQQQSTSRPVSAVSSRPVSARQRQIINETQNYFLQKVDPLIGPCITFLLCNKIQSTEGCLKDMIEYFRKLQAKQPLELINPQKKAKKEQKVFLATTISPIINKLINRLAVKRPEDVIEFIISELMNMLEMECVFVSSMAQEEPQQSLPNKQVTEYKIQLAFFGDGSAGKTSIFNTLQGVSDPKLRPTLGFKPCSMMLNEHTKVTLYDLGGGKKIRNIWEQYYHDVHGVVYVLDSAAPSSSDSPSTPSIDESIALFHSTIQNSYLANKPILIYANKQDIPGSLSPSDLAAKLNIPSLESSSGGGILPSSPYKIQGCRGTMIEKEGGVVSAEGEPELEADSRVEAGLEWLLGQIQSRYESLNERVQRDISNKSIEEARKKTEKERRILRDRIAVAFPHLLSPDLLPQGFVENQMQKRAKQRKEAGLPEDDAGEDPFTLTPEDVFPEDEGLAFLAAEISEDPAQLSPEALEIAALVGYQKLALQIVGGLKAPISKRKQALSWPEIREIVTQLRRDLGLPTSL